VTVIKLINCSKCQPRACVAWSFVTFLRAAWHLALVERCCLKLSRTFARLWVQFSFVYNRFVYSFRNVKIGRQRPFTFAPWVKRLLLQWMPRWWRVNGSTSCEPLPCTQPVLVSLRHFGLWDISVICLTVVLKLAVAAFTSLCFQAFWPKWLNFFRSFQKHFGLWPKKRPKKTAPTHQRRARGWIGRKYRFSSPRHDLTAN